MVVLFNILMKNKGSIQNWLTSLNEIDLIGEHKMVVLRYQSDAKKCLSMILPDENGNSGSAKQ